jgi:hypothetical protein
MFASPFCYCVRFFIALTRCTSAVPSTTLRVVPLPRFTGAEKGGVICRDSLGPPQCEGGQLYSEFEDLELEGAADAAADQVELYVRDRRELVKVEFAAQEEIRRQHPVESGADRIAPQQGIALRRTEVEREANTLECATVKIDVRSDAVAAHAGRHADESIGQKITENVAGSDPCFAVIGQAQATRSSGQRNAGDIPRRRVELARHLKSRRGRRGGVDGGVHVVALNTQHQVLPLRIVAEKSAATESVAGAIAEQTQLRRRECLLHNGVLQGVLNTRRRRAGKIGRPVVEAATNVETAPAREGRGADAVQGRRRLNGAAQDGNVRQIVIGGQRVR